MGERLRNPLENVPVLVDPAHVLAIEVAWEANTQLTSHDLVRALACSTTCRRTGISTL